MNSIIRTRTADRAHSQRWRAWPFILGTSGEAPSSVTACAAKLVERVCRRVSGRARAGWNHDTSIVEALGLAHAADSERRRWLPPHLITRRRASRNSSHCRAPRAQYRCRYLYNMPQMTKVEFAPDTLKRLTHLEGIAGIKDSSGNFDYFGQVLG